MQAIETATVGSGGASSITFSAIAADYTDLKLVISARSSASASYDPILIRFNGSTSDYSARDIRAQVGSYTQSGALTTSTSSSAGGTWGRTSGVGMPTSNQTSNTFGSASIYLPGYLSANNKSYSYDVVGENNGTAASLGISAGLWADTDAITSFAIALKDGDFVEHSTATLYGIKSTAGSGAPKATGGLISYDAANNKWVHVFTASGTFTPTEDLTCEYLVIAGAGGGGGGYGGGGGAGGYRSSVAGESSGGGASAESALSLTSATGYTVTIGAGGTAGSAGFYSGNGGLGSNSVFSSITSNGGGGGGNSDGSAGSGGSGGGAIDVENAAGSGTSGQGLDGGTGSGAPKYGSGGGGGAGVAGTNGTSTSGGNGGNGLGSDITGASVTRAGGGAGGTIFGGTQGLGGTGGGGDAGSTSSYPDNGEAGTVNTGGGGGGASANPYTTTGGSGASGIVIVRYDA